MSDTSAHEWFRDEIAVATAGSARHYDLDRIVLSARARSRARSLRRAGAGAGGVLVTGVTAGAVAFTGGAPGSSAVRATPGGASLLPPASSSTTLAVPLCGPDDMSLQVAVNRTSVPRTAISGPTATTGAFTVRGVLRAHSRTPCRLFYEDGGGLVFTGADGRQHPFNSGSCYDPAVGRLDPTGPAPPALVVSTACAQVPHRLFPTGADALPADHGALYAVEGSGADRHALEDAHRGIIGTPEPVFRSLEVGYGDNPDLAPGRYTAQMSYGPWSGSADFTVTTG